MNQIANPGSTIGEAIGALIEQEVNRIFDPIVRDTDCVFVTAGKPNPKTGKATKLLLKDKSGTEFNIDAVIANARMQPLVLIESKYIRYKKHNRDKGSWICTAHYSLRHTFPTIRRSIAVLAGSWSQPSKKLMESFDISLYEVSFEHIRQVLASYQVDIEWDEKDRKKVLQALHRWQTLSQAQYSEIAFQFLRGIAEPLRESLLGTLKPDAPREVSGVRVVIETNWGESSVYTFGSLSEALDFLNSFDQDEMLSEAQGPVLWQGDSDSARQG